MAKAKPCFLRYQDDYLDDATFFTCIDDAKADFKKVTRDPWRFGQSLEATIHIIWDEDVAQFNIEPGDKVGQFDGLKVEEYPDYVLSLGKFGGMKVERA